MKLSLTGFAVQRLQPLGHECEYLKVEPRIRFEPTTYCLRCSRSAWLGYLGEWRVRKDSNLRETDATDTAGR